VASSDLSGHTIGDFDVIDVLGQGGFATVYRARQRSLDREVALKVLNPLLARDPTTAARFEREGRSAAQLDHPHIVGVYTAGHDGDVVYLAMRLVPGTTLEERIKSGPVPRPEVVRIVSAVAEALEHAHSRGLVHRDVKPANILLDGDRVYLSDFGIAVAGEEAGRYTVGGIGTVDYIAPEQAEGGPITPQADLYALGCTAYHALTGSPPFQHPSHLVVLLAHARDPIPPMGDAGLNAFFATAMAKAPADRFPDARAQAAAFAAAALPTSGPVEAPVEAPVETPVEARPSLIPAGPAGSGPPAPPAPPGSPGGLPVVPPAPPRGRWLTAGLVGAALLVVVAVGAWALRDRDGGDPPASEPPTSVTAPPGGSEVAGPTPPPTGPVATEPPATAPATTGPDATGPATAGPSATGSPTAEPTAPGAAAVLGTTARVAYTDATDGDDFDIYTARGDGSDVQQVTDGPWRDWHPAWSPDRTRIIFSSDRDQTPGAFSLFVVDAAGGEPERLTDGTSDHDPDWSPDGSRIVFWRFGPGGDADLHILDLVTGEVQRIGGTQTNDLRPAWISDDEIAWMADDGEDRDLYSVAADGSNPRLLYDEPGVQDKNPTIAPDGRTLVFNQTDGPVLQLSLDGPPDDVLTLLDGQVVDDPQLSPEGTALAAVRDLGGGRTELVTFALDGSGRSFSFGEHLLEPAW
jgi:tRNA A-37 threonylcarbamoyl transferase component Bud32